MCMSESLPTVYAKAFLCVFGPLLITWLVLPFIPFVNTFVAANFILINVIIVAYMVISSIFVVYLYLAPDAIAFIFALENVATLIQSGGKFVDVAYSSRDRVVREDFEVDLEPNRKESWIKKNLGGLTFYGLPPFRDVLFIDLRHNKLIETMIENSREVQYRIEKTIKRTSRIDLKTTNYAMSFNEMEAKDRIQIYAVIVATLRVSNIYTFLNNRDPYGRLEEFLWAAFRTFVRDFEVDELIGNRSTGNKDNQKAIKNERAMLGKRFFDYLMNDYAETTNVKIGVKKRNEGGVTRCFIKIDDLGFEISNFAVLDINLKDRSAEEASQMLYVAEKKRQAIIIEAEAEAEKIRKLAEAEAQKINMVSEVCKKNGIPPSLPVVTEKMGPDQANYFYWHGDHDGRNLNGQQAHTLTEEQIKKALSAFIDSQQVISPKKEKEQP